MYKHKLLWSILTSIFCVLFVAMLVGTTVALNFGSAAINKVLGTSNYKRIDDPDAEASVFYASDYGDIDGESLFSEDKKMIEETEAEGATLLWNRNGVLPLVGNEKVSCLGRWSVDLTETGTGSGYSVTRTQQSSQIRSVNLKEALESRGFSVNDTLWKFYSSGAGSTQKTDPKGLCLGNVVWSMNEPAWSKYTDAVKSSFSEYGDVAVVVLSRTGGENSDLHESSEVSYENGGYLGLTDEEKDLLKNIGALKGTTFKKVVMLLNTVNPLQMQDLAPYSETIDACMWIGQPGSSGTNAIADLLKGETMQGDPISPSGHIVDTYVYDNLSAPATENDGLNSASTTVNRYAGNLSGLSSTAQNGESQTKYIVYQEGGYIGYRYYETRYADCVMEQGNANADKGACHSASGWDYSEEVAFPFGYGESYAAFEYSHFSVTKEEENYIVSVTVKNASQTYSGKEAVQVYMQRPYTDYDKQNGIEKPAIELAGYAKTKLLAPDEEQTVKVTVPAEYFKTYDAGYAGGTGRYILEQGDYYLTVGTDAHTALNNVLEAQGYTCPAQKVMSDTTKAVDLGAKFAAKFTLEQDNEKYLHSSYTGKEVVNRLQYGDINQYANRGDNSVVYLSRSDWAGTYPSRVQLTMNEEMKKDLGYNFDFEETEIFMPTYSEFRSGSTTGVPDVEKGDVVAYQFIDAPLDENDPEWNEFWADMWEQLLDQMSWEEQAQLCTNGYHQMCGAVSIALPASKQENGPVGITYCSDFPIDTIGDFVFVGYPCAPIIAATFNDDIAERVGEHMSEDMLYTGYNGIYGPGVNLHRSPYGGRAFEYPSEDPLLAGKIMAAECRGIENKGCLAYPKHFALNEMETSRMHCGVWSNEQASREVYLRAFEIVFTEGEASATMNSFTRIGTRWCGASHELMTDILRGEWGFDGIILTDWDEGKVMSKCDAILAGTNTFDGNGTLGSYAPWKNSPTVAAALRESCKYLIYNIVRTNVMNGVSIKSRVVQVTPWWEVALKGITIGTGVVAVVCIALLTVSVVQGKKYKKRK